MSGGSEVIVPLGSVVDITKERRRLRDETEALERQLRLLRERLQNPGFITRAPAHVVEGERAKEREWARRIDQLTKKVRSLCGD
jgi:valyl-tRNA synthetase